MLMQPGPGLRLSSRRTRSPQLIHRCPLPHPPFPTWPPYATISEAGGLVLHQWLQHGQVAAPVAAARTTGFSRIASRMSAVSHQKKPHYASGAADRGAASAGARDAAGILMPLMRRLLKLHGAPPARTSSSPSHRPSPPSCLSCWNLYGGRRCYSCRHICYSCRHMCCSCRHMCCMMRHGRRCRCCWWSEKECHRWGAKDGA